MYPHERSLVKRLADQPFVLLGINSDKDREALKEVLEQQQLTWRSWWDGGSTHGPIASKWNVSGWPTTYVLDAEGVIRYKNVRGPAMDKAVDTLLAELAGGSPPAGDEAAEEAEDGAAADQEAAAKKTGEGPSRP